MFLVETDTNSINEQKDYKIKGYKTWFHLKKEPIHKTRMISLINENKENLKIRTDLMDTEIPSIWVEELNENSKNILTCGLHREWPHEGSRTVEQQNMALY